MIRRLRLVIRGAVQGVGFRPFVYRLATELGLNGWVINSAQGVFIEIEGDNARLSEFLRRVSSEKPVISYIQSLESSYLDAVGCTRFEIRESEGGEKTALILPDIATCPDCRCEIDDPSNRRYRYPFTNCTNCGPRFTIIEELPYDRPRTTMKQFKMCADCDREYHDPSNRRFHAQPNACPVCGPHLELWDAEGKVLADRDDALKGAARNIEQGRIVAVKGLGGFHLLVDARNEAAVAELRRRKHREEKPLALMYPSYEQVKRHCELSEVEDRLLRSPESPIVLLRKRNAAADGVAASLAPGNPYLGVMLPYTPLHHLLLAELGFPVVATSGNLSDEPICIDEHEAVRRLKGLADLFLVHDRPILRHVDDSIVREMGGRELVLRRARGFAPLPVPIEEELPPLLAVGAHLKNTVAISVRKQVFISQHIGDLETPEALDAFERVIASFRKLYEIEPTAVAADMHPDYLSTQWAARSGLPIEAVQHHYAHALACMAENHIRPPALAISWDGSGYGTDATVWGGEFLEITDAGFRRIAHLRTFSLPGGESAVKQPRRVALSILLQIFGPSVLERTDLAPIAAFTVEERKLLHSMIERGVNSPATSSMGRLFDAVASIARIRQVCRFEGQAAMELEFAAARTGPDDAYPFLVTGSEGAWVVDWEPLIRALLDDVARREATSAISHRFHNALALVIAEIGRRSVLEKVVLTGGCFQNRVLTECALRHIQACNRHAYWHQRVPPNDGGIALGQLIAASRRTR